MSLAGCDEEARQTLIRLLEGDEEESWRVTPKALADSRKILPNYKGHLGVYAVNLFILAQLRRDFPLHAVQLGSGAIACVMNNADGHGLYIKLTIQDDLVVVLSFHISIYHKGD